MSDENFLSRWSRRKHDAAAGRPLEEPAPDVPAAAHPGAAPVAPSDDVPPAPAPLPPVESLSIESDFSPFMAKEVDPALKRAALKTLFQDERFNVMDGLDVYIDDYTKPSPIPAEWYGKMAQMAQLGDVAGRREEEERRAAREIEAGATADAPAPSEPETVSAPVDAPPPAPDISRNDTFKSLQDDAADSPEP